MPAPKAKPASPPAAARPSGWREALKQSRTAAPMAVLALSVWLVATAAIRFSGFDASSCPNSFPADGWLTGAFTAGVGAFLLGGLLGGLSHKKPDKPTVGLATQLGVTSLVAVLTIAWWYETRAVAGMPSWLPITHFVMCLKHYENDWTLLVFILAALLAGRWLWHRPGTYLQ